MDKESILRSKLQELIAGDQDCNDLFDDTIITWENIVDRTKSIVEEFSKSHTDTTTTNITLEVCGNRQDDDGDGLIDETCPGFVLLPENPSDGIDNDGDRLIDETGSQPIDLPEEICDDNIDNDGDGTIDEGCPDGPPDPNPHHEDPSDGKDNDGDRLIDETSPEPIIDIDADSDVIDISKDQQIVDTILKSLDVTKNTDIDKRDHTLIENEVTRSQIISVQFSRSDHGAAYSIPVGTAIFNIMLVYEVGPDKEKGL